MQLDCDEVCGQLEKATRSAVLAEAGLVRTENAAGSRAKGRDASPFEALRGRALKLLDELQAIFQAMGVIDLPATVDCAGLARSGRLLVDLLGDSLNEIEVCDLDETASALLHDAQHEVYKAQTLLRLLKSFAWQDDDEATLSYVEHLAVPVIALAKQRLLEISETPAPCGAHSINVAEAA